MVDNKYFLRFILLLITFCLVHYNTILAQDSCSYKIHVFSKIWHQNKLIVKPEVNFGCKTNFIPILDSIKTFYQKQGYLDSYYEDSLYCISDSCLIYFIAGKKYILKSVSNGNIDQNLFNEILPQKFRNKEINNLNFITKKTLSYLEQNGYPFAEVYFDSFQLIDSTSFNAKIYIDKGPLIYFSKLNLTDSLSSVKKRGKINHRFISSYLGINEGKPYQESLVKRIPTRVKELGYLSLVNDPFVYFLEDKAEVQLQIRPKKSSKFDVIFGLLPSNNPVNGQQRFNFTGNVLIDLLNTFGRGERLVAQWQQFIVGRSELKIMVNYPYLFKTPIGLDAKFELYQRDSTYIDVIGEIGAQYFFHGSNFLKVYFKTNSTIVQKADSSFVLRNRKLPTILDLNNNALGIEYRFQNLDYRWNPRKGFDFKCIVQLGYRSIIPNNSILKLRDPLQIDGNFSYLYDSLNKNSFFLNSQIQLSYFMPLFRSATILFQTKMAYLWNNNIDLYTNELYRTGGQHSLRGFDEQSIFSSWYHITNIEPRFLFNENSYFYAFFDLGIFPDLSQSISTRFKYGFGIGLALETKIGIFGLSYALGSDTQEALLFRNGKIHFGYINLF